MNPTKNSNGQGPMASGSGLRNRVVFGALLLVAVIIGSVIVFGPKSTPPAKDAPPQVVATGEPAMPEHTQRATPALPIVRSEPVAVQPAPAPALEVASNTAPVAGTPPLTETNLNSKQLVADLVGLKPDGAGGITKEQADKFKENMAQLIQQGPAGVPAIQEFLNKNIDSAYDAVEGGDQLGYSSLRAGMLDALKQIGGPEALGAMAEVIQTTAVPGEILEVAKNLEQAAPGQYSEAIMKAAKDAVEMSSKNQLGPNVEVGPAFKVIQSYSDPNPRALVGGSEGQTGN